LMIGDNKL